MRFTKMHGTGNDYIYINCFEETVKNPESLAISLSRRHFSVGADGIVLILPSDIADAKMRMFNADGSEGKMCGNAIRCVGKYLYEQKIIDDDTIYVETLSGIKTLRLNISNGLVDYVCVNLGKASFNTRDLPASTEKPELLNEHFSVLGKDYIGSCVSIGNPHLVIMDDNLETLDLDKIGKHFENYPLFPERINTEFVKIIGRNEILMRVYERGSGETLACGTGASACVCVLIKNGFLNFGEEITVNVLGGKLIIFVDSNFNVLLKGKALKVFEGELFYEF